MSLEKIKKLKPFIDEERVTVSNFLRLVDGDLAHIGDALVEGKQIQVTIPSRGNRIVDPLKMYFEEAYADYYSVVEERITVGDVSFPKPETKAPANGTVFWVPAVSNMSELAIRYVWRGGTHLGVLKRGLVHLSADAAREHAEAIIKLSGGEV